jgi:hypothetical protein
MQTYSKDIEFGSYTGRLDPVTTNARRTITFPGVSRAAR